MSFIAFVNNEASALRFYQETSTVSIISEQPSYFPKTYFSGVNVGNLAESSRPTLPFRRICL